MNIFSLKVAPSGKRRPRGQIQGKQVAQEYPDNDELAPANDDGGKQSVSGEVGVIHVLK